VDDDDDNNAGCFPLTDHDIEDDKCFFRIFLTIIIVVFCGFVMFGSIQYDVYQRRIARELKERLTKAAQGKVQS
jgi:hypothetical protein